MRARVLSCSSGFWCLAPEELSKYVCQIKWLLVVSSVPIYQANLAGLCSEVPCETSVWIIGWIGMTWNGTYSKVNPQLKLQVAFAHH